MPVEPDWIELIGMLWYFLATVFLYLFSSQISTSAVHLRATSMADVSMDWVPSIVIANLAFMVMVSDALSWQVSSMTTRVMVMRTAG